MKKQCLIAAICSLLVFTGCTVAKSQKVSREIVYEENWDSLARHNKEPDWFADAKLGIYFHWGIYSVPAFKGEWYPRWMYVPDRKAWGSGTFQYHEKTYGHPSVFNYHDFVPMFKAEHFDPGDWAELFQKAGARFAGPVAIHHDGFAMWESEVNPWNAGAMGPKRDIAGELYRELEKRNIKKIATFHHAKTLQRNAADTAKWADGSSHFPYHPDYATSSIDPKLRMLYGNIPEDEFNDYWLGQITEVIDKYSPEIIWFDSWLSYMPEEYLLKMVAYQFNTGVSKGQQNLVAYKQKDLPRSVGVLDIEQGGMKEMSPDFWLTDITLSYSSWCWVQGQTYKDAALVLRNMIDVWSKKGVVLLNISPKADGTIPNEQREVLVEIGAWLDTYGEAVYETRPHSIFGYGSANIEDGNHGGQKATIEYSADDIRFTASKDGKALYIFCLGKPEAGEVMKIEHVHQNGNPSSLIKSVTLLGNSSPMKWDYRNSVLEIKAPEHEQMNEIATIFKVEFM